MFAIFKREFKALFQNVVGWLFVGVTLALFGLYFFAYNLSNGLPSIAYTLSATTFIYIITVPLLTMRAFAEERKNMTDQLLLTSPVSVGKIVLGKFLALVATLTIPVLVMCLSPLFLRIFGEVSFPTNYTAILGYYLYGLTCIAIGMFISSLENKDLSNKCIVMDDPVVSLDVIGYQNVRNVIAGLTKKFDEETTKLIILTHDINYLYIQLSNVFDDPDMSSITEVYKFCDTKFKPVSLEILNVDDITLYKLGIKNAKYINDIKALATLNCKTFRILIDLKARFQGTPISSNVDVEALLIDKEKKDKLRAISNYFSKVYKNPDIIDAELLESFNKIKEACSLLDLYELISQEELDNISSIIGKDEIGENDSEVFDIINQVSIFIRTTSNMNLRNYINHPRNYFTKNIVTLSLDNEL